MLLRSGLLWCALVGPAMALPQLQDISGDLSGAEISAGLAPVDHWFIRADHHCGGADASACRITLALSVSAGGQVSNCQITSTTITDDSVRALYCQIAKTAQFVAKDHDSSFVMVFPEAPGAAPPPTDTRRLIIDLAKPCADLDHERNQDDVHGCFDQYQAYFDAAYKDELKQNPNLQGSFLVRLSIGKKGEVQDASADYVEGGLPQDFIDTELGLVKKMRFGYGAVDISSTYSLHFLATP